jgi:F-type H+-transporting ATPase subunit b
MLIDWFTVGAQALNFILLVWLMKRFLYKPILQAVAARETRIATELANADATRDEARRERDEFQRKNAALDQQRAAFLKQAVDDAEAEHARLMGEARSAADALSAKRQAALNDDVHNLNRAISHRTQQEVFAIARKALADLATASLEERLSEVFMRRLRAMDSVAKASFGEALQKASEPALLRCTFDLPTAQQAALQHALNETFSAEVRVRFETAPELVCGIELSTLGLKLAWSIADYLVSLEQSVRDLLNKPAEPSPTRTNNAAKPREAISEYHA